MNIYRLFKTVSYLRPIQIYNQIKFRIYKPVFRKYKSLKSNQLHYKSFIKKNDILEDKTFDFLNIKKPFIDWNDTSNGKLWVYNLNYMDWLLQNNISYKDGIYWIYQFISGLQNNKYGLEAYPISLRGINWIKFITIHYKCFSKNQLNIIDNSLYSQYKLLIKKLEYHLLGNHLLENAFSLFIASLYFCDFHFYEKARAILIEELREQILLDGAHYEQSPMYHCILLERILDCYNFSVNNKKFVGQEELELLFQQVCIKMLGHLESILYTDLSFPLFNDSAYGVASNPKKIFIYANILNLEWTKLDLKDCGYRKMFNNIFEAFLDVGNIMASYQPGHSHADVFNYEIRVAGYPFIVDSGVSTYNDTSRRLYERSSLAHNTPTLDKVNTCDVWSSFRLGDRANVSIIKDTTNEIIAKHDGYYSKYKAIVRRSFKMLENEFIISESISTKLRCISYIHFAPNIESIKIENSIIKTDLGVIEVEGFDKLILYDDFVSKQYNTLLKSKLLEIHYYGSLKYTIIPYK